MKKYFYNVYKNGVLHESNILCKRVVEITKISHNDLSHYVKIGKIYHKNGDAYQIEINHIEEIVKEKKTKKEKKVKVPKPNKNYREPREPGTVGIRNSNGSIVNIPIKLINEWNNMMKAAEVLKHGGHIVKMGKRKFVVKGR
jgi:hypothetical protein